MQRNSFSKSEKSESWSSMLWKLAKSGFGNLSSGFGSGTGFSFGFMNKKSDTSQDSETDNAEVVKDEGEEQDEGAKEEGKQEAVVEEGAFYSKKCKLFYKKEVLFEITFNFALIFTLAGCQVLYGKRPGKYSSEAYRREKSTSKFYRNDVNFC